MKRRKSMLALALCAMLCFGNSLMVLAENADVAVAVASAGAAGVSDGDPGVSDGDPSKPDGPSVSDGDPSKPVDPSDPDGPSVSDGDPSKPVDPSDPDGPSVSDGDPSKPVDPSDPDGPSVSDGDPSEPENPDTPDEPNKPSEPGTPDEPNKPSEPGTPDEPNKPSEPDTPDEPELPTITVTDPEQIADAATAGNVVYTATVTATTVAVQIDTVIQKNVFETVKAYSTTVSFAFNDAAGQAAYTWSFSGTSITDASVSISNFAIQSGRSFEAAAVLKDKVNVSDQQYVGIHFAHDGRLPGTAAVRVKVDLTDGDGYYLYYFNPVSKSFALVNSNVQVTGGFAQFNIDHCSDYVLTKEPIPAGEDSGNDDNDGNNSASTGNNAKSPKTGE